jgi:hypothetical protein
VECNWCVVVEVFDMSFLFAMILNVAISRPDVVQDRALERTRPETANIPGSTLEDDAQGVCAAFSHFHAYDPSDPLLDGKCHTDDDDRVMDPATSVASPSTGKP